MNKLSRQSLVKLFRDELINLVMNQQTEKRVRRPKFTIPNKVKKFLSKYKPTIKKSNVVTYDKKPISLAQFRYDELDLAGVSSNTLGSTFLSLFQKRLNNMLNIRENVQITLFIDIGNIIDTKVTSEEKNNKTYDQSTKVIRSIQNINSKIR